MALISQQLITPGSQERANSETCSNLLLEERVLWLEIKMIMKLRYERGGRDGCSSSRAIYFKIICHSPPSPLLNWKKCLIFYKKNPCFLSGVSHCCFLSFSFFFLIIFAFSLSSLYSCPLSDQCFSSESLALMSMFLLAFHQRLLLFSAGRGIRDLYTFSMFGFSKLNVTPPFPLRSIALNY